MQQRKSTKQCSVAECGRASGERRAATDASPQAASPQLNSTLGRKRGDWEVWVEVLKSSTASTDTENNVGNEGIVLDGLNMPKTSM